MALKRFIVILTLSLFILTVTECNQLLKLPVLLEHYIEHKTSNQDISFSDFLYMHYAGNDFNDQDQDRDMQLPFKSHSQFTSLDVQSLPLQPETISLKPVTRLSKSSTVYKRLNFQSSYLSSIWQPPKSC